MLTRQPVRLLVALAGISFAGILMFMQFGFHDGLFEASVTVHRLFDADLVLISPSSVNSVQMEGFKAASGSITGRFKSVEFPLCIGVSCSGETPKHNAHSLLALGYNPDDAVFLDPDFATESDELKLKGRVLFDELSRPEFGPIADNSGRNVGRNRDCWQSCTGVWSCENRYEFWCRWKSCYGYGNVP